MHKNKLVNIILSVCFGILAIFPLALGSFSAIRNFMNYQAFRFGAISLISFLIATLFILNHVNFRVEVKDWILISALFGLTIAIRLLSQNTLDTEPITDFQDAITKATYFLQGPYPDVRSARFPYWGFYKLTLSQVFTLFGASFNTVEFLNIFLAGVTTTGLYLLAKKTSGSKKFALICTTIYALWPADAFYKNLPNGEHIFISLLPFACLIYVNAMERLDKNLSLSLILSLLTGLLLGLMDLYRPVAIILLIACAIALVLFKFIKNDYQKFFLLEKTFWGGIVMIACLMIGFQGTKMLGFAAIRQKTGYAPNTSGYGWTLRIGLDVTEGGLWNRVIYDRMIAIYEAYDENYAKVNAILLDETKMILVEQKPQLFRFFLNKFDFTWKSDYDFFYWATVKQSDDGSLLADPNNIGSMIMPITDAFHAFVLVFSTTGAIYCALNKKEPITSILALFIIGFSVMLLLTEVQQRYRSVLFSTLPIFASYGIFGVTQVITPAIKKLLGKANQGNQLD